MKALKILLIVLVSLILAVSPVALPLICAMALPPQYDYTYLGALDEKYERLNSIDEPKIILVGGSSVAFGVDSERLEEYTGMPVVNFGLYAALGTKLMLDLSRSGINEGDVIVISPELDPQTLSLYFSTQSTFKAIDADYSMLRYIEPSDVFKMLGGVWDFLSDKWLSYQEGDAQGDSSSGIYKSEYFNVSGDFVYPREENVMPGYFDKNTPVRLNDTIFTDEYYEFIDYLNEYINYARIKGASVYFSYCPVNELSLSDTDSESIAMVDAKMREDINCRVIGSLEASIMEAGYFYDTNFHLNDRGRIARTIALGKGIKLYHGITDGVIKAETPPAPALPFDPYSDTVDENSKYFLYEKQSDGGYAIVGLSELGRRETELTVPLSYDSFKVTSIAEGAFTGSALEKLVIPNAAYLRSIENGAFTGASKLRELWIYKDTGDAIAPPLSFYGTASGFTVHVPKGSDYGYHYYWSERGLKFVYDAN